MKETIIQFTSGYWVLTGTETSKGLGDVLGPLECDTAPFIVELTSREGAGLKTRGTGQHSLGPHAASGCVGVLTRAGLLSNRQQAGDWEPRGWAGGEAEFPGRGASGLRGAKTVRSDFP